MLYRLINKIRNTGPTPYKEDVITVGIDELFEFTMYKTRRKAPWSYDKKKYYHGLRARYEFVKSYFERGRKLTEQDIKGTYYFEILSRGLKQRPRDGGDQWVYHDPYVQSQRFIALIESILSQGYIFEKDSNYLNEFTKSTPEHLELNKDGSVCAPNYSDRPYDGLIWVVPYKEYYAIKNGTHRLAILKVMRELGHYKDNSILVLKIK